MSENTTENSERADSGATALVPKGHPLMKAWEKFKASDEFANSKRWAAHPEHLDGSLWALFDAGWHAGVSAAMGMEPIYTAGVNPCAEPFTAKAKGVVAGDGKPCPNDHDPECGWPDCNCRLPWPRTYS
jgi:hypothetical protein